jgi:Ca-activated chloride channel family protein
MLSLQKIRAMYCKKILLSLMLLGMCGILAKGQTTSLSPQQPKTRILFIFDASNSMWGNWQSDKKIHIANRLLSKMIDSLENYPNVELALRVYGHQYEYKLHNCNDTKLEVPFGPNNFQRIQQKLKTIRPKGTTPIAMSLAAAEQDFASATNSRNIIILITDGIEECSGNPCEVSQALQRKGIMLKPFIIGIGTGQTLDLSCVGNYLDASSEKAFDQALTIIIEQIFNKTTCQVSLLDANGKPTESNVNMSFIDESNNTLAYNYIHTMNPRGLPDTLYLNAMPSYRIKVHTLPPVEVEHVKLNPGTHTVIPIDVPQGNLLVKTTTAKSTRYNSVPVIVRKSGSAEIVNVQYFNIAEKYLTGKYDLEILCLPRVYINNVDVSQSYTTQIKVADPGVAIIQKGEFGYGSLYVVKDGKDEWIYNLRSDDTSESIMLQPGTYKVVFRKDKEYQTIKTWEHVFVVKSNATTNVNVPK